MVLSFISTEKEGGVLFFVFVFVLLVWKSIYGPVQDVRIPYQQKRMFGFVTFVYPETVKLILAKGNPHFVCDARVLVKPYKEKGKVPDKYRHSSLSLSLIVLLIMNEITISYDGDNSFFLFFFSPVESSNREREEISLHVPLLQALIPGMPMTCSWVGSVPKSLLCIPI